MDDTKCVNSIFFCHDGKIVPPVLMTEWCAVWSAHSH